MRTTDPKTGAESWRHDDVFGKNVSLQKKKDVIRRLENAYYDLVGMHDDLRRPLGADGWPSWFNWAVADWRIFELEQLTHAVLNKNSRARERGGALWRRAMLPVAQGVRKGARAARKVFRAAVAPVKWIVKKNNEWAVSDNPRDARSLKVF